MDMSQYNGAAFLKVGDIKASGPIKVVIVKVEEGKYGKADLTFDDGTKLSVSKTNNRVLCRAFGTDSAGWIGQTIELSVGETPFMGELTETIVATPVSPGIKATKKAKSKDAGDAELNDPAPF